jgi:photosystem II stability/assembly factor-like uncharacterized protein
MSRLKSNRGVSVVSVVIMMLIMAAMGSVMVSLVATESDTSVRQMKTSQAQYVAEGGMEYALYQFKTGTACASLSYSNISLGAGMFSTTGTVYNPSSTTLSGGINGSVTTIPVVSTTGYASHGRITIDSETIDYAGITATSFTGARRGANGTTAASHSSGAAVPQNQCMIRATGTVSAAGSGSSQRVVEVGTVRATGGTGTWNGQTSGTGQTLRGVHFPVDATTGWVVGNNGVIRKTTNGGAAWTGQTSGTGDDLHSVFFPVDALTGWAVGQDGTIRKTTNGGTSWNGQTSGTGQDLRSVHFPVDATTGWVVGNNGVIRKTTNGGTTWTGQTSGTTDDLYSVYFPMDTLTGWAVGQDGTIRKTTNGGTTWTAETSGTGNDLRSVHFPVDTCTGYAVGNNGTIRKRTSSVSCSPGFIDWREVP